MADKRYTPPSDVNKGSEDELTSDSMEDGSNWLRKAQDAFEFSTTFIDANYRNKWESGINAFNSVHDANSKYNTSSFDKRSKLFRPKTRSIIRKVEAAAAAAYFSNSDVLSIEAENSNDKTACAGAEMMKELIQHHLTKNVPWFQIVQGGLQDAMVTGCAVAHVYWETKGNTEESDNESSDSDYSKSNVKSFMGQPENAPSIDYKRSFTSDSSSNTNSKKVAKLIKDKPCVDLIPIENIRFDPAASWTNPVETSPYLIHLIPMYVGDVKTMMTNGKWKRYSESIIKSALQTKSDTTNQARLKKVSDPYNTNGKTISDYEIVWVQRHIHREDDVDYDFYTLGDVALLSEPVPLIDNVFHGMRPYVIGNCVLETHKVIPSSIPELSRGLQEEANEISNQRLDNVKFSMNKRYIVARNKQVDIQSLIRNVPGGITMADSVDDIREVSTPDVTQSSYLEQDRINTDMDELLGNFGAGTVQANKQLAQTVTGMSMMNSSANTLVEYTLRTFTETFIEPILNQLVLLERHYETDEVLLDIIGNRTGVFKKLGTDENADKLLQHNVSLKVNVGMGATSPEQKLNKLTQGIMSYGNIVKMGIPNLNTSEIGKEIFGALGYSDGSRFITQSDNPEITQLQQQIQQLESQLKTKTQPVEIAKMNNDNRLQIATMKEGHLNSRKLVDHYASIAKSGLKPIADAGAIKTLENSQPTKQQPLSPQRKM